MSGTYLIVRILEMGNNGVNKEITEIFKLKKCSNVPMNENCLCVQMTII